MKKITYIAVAIVALAFGSAHADGMKSQGDAFNAGKDFANAGKGTAGSQINSGTGSQNLPYYGTSAPESANYNGGRNLIGGAGSQKQADCLTSHAPNGFAQQECDAVNFLSKNSTSRPKYVIDKTKDPLLTGSKDVIGNPGTVPGASSQQCRVVREKHPASYITETCTETQKIENQSCAKALQVTVQMNCQPDSLFPALDMARNEVDHVTIFAKCDMQAINNSYIEMTADAFGIEGGQVRNQVVKIPKNLGEIPASQWVKSKAGKTGYLLVTVQPHWMGRIRQVPVYILPDSTGCKAGSRDCAYHFYWEWWDHQLWEPDHLMGASDGWATGVIGEIKIWDSWDNQCQYLESNSR
ncbi:TPA: hypothetical protein ACUNF5_005238 [Burkholderia orbicola]